MYARRSLGINIDIMYRCMGIHAKREKDIRLESRSESRRYIYIACG